ncbi:hypothetical protein L3Q82_003098 [Scortum barcoo]|uniref:Uncharacterized protein n=1 Tax=Scortum barcoo TaxID=214431 RepID=A0ACB8VRJ0_9TELE|nr:hypothetical protein L3Q82_003098 [Scortum barcoo]
MRFHWLITLLSILVSMGLLVIITGQYQALIKMEQRGEKLKEKSKTLDDQRILEDSFKATEEMLLVQGRKHLENLEALVAKLVPEMEEKKREDEACLAEMKAFNHALEKERSEAEAPLRAESQAWKAEIETLNAQLQGYRPMCDYVSANTLAGEERREVTGRSYANKPITEGYRALSVNVRPSSHGHTGAEDAARLRLKFVFSRWSRTHPSQGRTL